MPREKRARDSKKNRLEPLSFVIERDAAAKPVKESGKKISPAEELGDERPGPDDAEALRSKLSKLELLAEEDLCEEDEEDEEFENFEAEVEEGVPHEKSSWDKFIDEQDEVEEQTVQRSSLRTLADIYLDKLSAAEQAEAERVRKSQLGPDILRTFAEVGTYMEWYRSGKVPKAFKIIPQLHNWEYILQLTRPEDWTPAATKVGTKLFARTLSEKNVVKYFSLVLLPAILRNLAEEKKLNVHLYNAVLYATFKSAAFFKGIFLPLMTRDDVTYKEALVMRSVVNRSSLKAAHVAAALFRLLPLPWKPCLSMMIGTLINKKYNLPQTVLDQLCAYFSGFTTSHSNEEMPVVWHQSLLVFSQRYGACLDSNQLANIIEVLSVHKHPLISPEIKSNLRTNVSRGMDVDFL